MKAPTLDHVIVDRIHAGDAERFRLLVERNLRPCWLYALTMLGSVAAARGALSRGLVNAFALIAAGTDVGETPTAMLAEVRRAVLASPEPALAPPDFSAATVQFQALRRGGIADGLMLLHALALLRVLPPSLRDAWVLRFFVACSPADYTRLTGMDASAWQAQVQEAAGLLGRRASAAGGEA